MSISNGSMDYRGINISGSSGGQTPISSGYVKYKREWDAYLSYYINDYVFYQQKSYIAVQDSIGVTPGSDTSVWELVSFWTNQNNVSNFRGRFAANVRMQNYDSIQDPNTFITYTYQGDSIYTTSTIANMIQDLVVLAPPPFLQLQNSTPFLFGFTGNGTDIETGALLFPYTSPPSIIQSDLNIQNILVNQGFAQQGTTIKLDGQFVSAKEGYYKVSATFLMWIYQNASSRQPPNDIYNNGGYFEIIKVDINSTRTGIVRNQVCTYKACTTIPPAFNIFYYPTSMTLECIIPLNFGEGIALNCTNVLLADYGFAIAPTLNIIYLGPRS